MKKPAKRPRGAARGMSRSMSSMPVMTSYSMPPAPEEEEGTSPFTIMIALVMFAVLCVVWVNVYDIWKNPPSSTGTGWMKQIDPYKQEVVTALAVSYSLVFLFFLYKIM